VPKDKKKKARKSGKSGKGGAEALKALAQNPVVADVVAAALVGMASALKDSDKAKRLANKAGDQLDAMSKSNARKGNAMWDLALDIGRLSLEAMTRDKPASKKAASKSANSRAKK
jgi:hypothetical protein